MKNKTRAFCVATIMLIVIMIISACTLPIIDSFDKDDTTKPATQKPSQGVIYTENNKEYLDYGYYPQTVVSDSATISALNSVCYF